MPTTAHHRDGAVYLSRAKERVNSRVFDPVQPVANPPAPDEPSWTLTARAVSTAVLLTPWLISSWLLSRITDPPPIVLSITAGAIATVVFWFVVFLILVGLLYASITIGDKRYDHNSRKLFERSLAAGQIIMVPQAVVDYISAEYRKHHVGFKLETDVPPTWNIISELSESITDWCNPDTSALNRQQIGVHMSRLVAPHIQAKQRAVAEAAVLEAQEAAIAATTAQQAAEDLVREREIFNAGLEARYRL